MILVLDKSNFNKTFLCATFIKNPLNGPKLHGLKFI